jgi:hypothetical protein
MDFSIVDVGQNDLQEEVAGDTFRGNGVEDIKDSSAIIFLRATHKNHSSCSPFPYIRLAL